MTVIEFTSIVALILGIINFLLRFWDNRICIKVKAYAYFPDHKKGLGAAKAKKWFDILKKGGGENEPDKAFFRQFDPVFSTPAFEITNKSRSVVNIIEVGFSRGKQLSPYRAFVEVDDYQSPKLPFSIEPMNQKIFITGQRFFVDMVTSAETHAYVKTATGKVFFSDANDILNYFRARLAPHE